jgi:glycosyltransferase involved in cell wall biosynthesis
MVAVIRPAPNVLIVQPTLHPPGGGNGVCAWILQALRGEYAVTLLTWEPVDLARVNDYFGTSLSPSDFTAVTTAPSLRAILDALPLPLQTVKTSILRRRAKRISAGFDVLMGAHNEADFGRPGIQFVHYPTRHMRALAVDEQWYHSPRTLALYDRCWSLIDRFDDASMRANVTLVNSQWTGRLVSRVHDVPVHVVYPPAPGDFAPVPWAAREDGFVCVGRLSPEKRVEDAIDIVARVRRSRPAAHLHVVGADDHPSYPAHVRALARRAGPWVTVEGPMPAAALTSLLSRHRYFVHAMRQEHFGMSVAQALRAGCIPFVFDDGGQVEIAGDEPLLRYRSIEDAAAKILTVMHDCRLQDALATRLTARAAWFSPDTFMTRVRGVVEHTLAARHRQTA